MNTDELIKVLSCGDASHEEQEQAAETIEALYRQNRELIRRADAMDRPEFSDYPRDGRYLICSIKKPAPKRAPGLWEHRDATSTGVCAKGCCDIYTCPACGSSWTDVKVY